MNWKWGREDVRSGGVLVHFFRISINDIKATTPSGFFFGKCAVFAEAAARRRVASLFICGESNELSSSHPSGRAFPIQTPGIVAVYVSAIAF